MERGRWRGGEIFGTGIENGEGEGLGHEGGKGERGLEGETGEREVHPGSEIKVVCSPRAPTPRRLARGSELFVPLRGF